MGNSLSVGVVANTDPFLRVAEIGLLDIGLTRSVMAIAESPIAESVVGVCTALVASNSVEAEVFDVKEALEVRICVAESRRRPFIVLFFEDVAAILVYGHSANGEQSSADNFIKHI